MTLAEQAFLAQVALGWFSIDSEGRIWRHVRFRGGGSSSLQRLEKPTRAERSSSRKGQYRRVMFRTPQGRMMVPAHRVVWMISNQDTIPSPMEINHENGIKSDNRPSNLTRVTRPENTTHSVRVLGNKPKARVGTDNSSAKLTEAQVLEIRALCASREMSQREIGRLFGLKQSTVSAIALRKSWAHLG